MSVAVLLSLLLISMFGGVMPKGHADTVPNPDHMIGGATGLGGKLIDPPTNLGGGLDLLTNVYETLISFSKDSVNSYIPVLATSWNITEDGLSYTFTTRQGVKFHNGEILTSEDVEYSMERILVIDDYNWSGNLLYRALFDLGGSRDENGNFIVTAEQLDNAITCTETSVSFHLSKPYLPFLQILCLPIMSVLNKAWCITNDEWPGTWNNWTYYNRRSSMINQQNTNPPGPHVNAMCGTGPFKLDYFTIGVEYSIIRFDDYWGGWPARGLNNSLSRATVKRILDWPTRRDMFLTGQLDFLDVPPTAKNEILGQPGVECVYPLPALEVQPMLFNFNISTSSPFLGVPGGLASGTFDESGIPPDLFTDIKVRKGFAFAFNYTQFIEEAFLGDAFQPATPIVPGLPYYNVDQEKYTQNLTKASEFLETAWNGQLWTKGLNMTISYWSEWGQKACENIKSNIETLNPKFHIEIQNLTNWNTYVPYLTEKEVPLILGGWAADFADPDNFASAFMDYSFGSWAYYQNFENATIEALVKQGIATTNTTLRQEVYYQLQRVYWENCVGVPLYQARRRIFMRDWVQGWCYNTVLGGGGHGLHNFYTEWKANVPPHPLHIGENLVDSINSTCTIVSINTTIPGNMTVKSYSISLEGTSEQGTNVSAVKCITVDTTVPHENITFPIEIRVYYTDQELVSAYVDQSSLHMFYWNGTNWLVENDSGSITPSDILGFSGYVWARIWHLSEFAVMGEQTLIHAVAPKDVRPAKTVVGQNYTASLSVDVFNQGDYEETFNVALYANTTFLETMANISLLPRNSATLSLVWNTSGFATGDYALTGVADPVPGETATMDNNYTGTIQVHVGVPGDVSSSVAGVYDKKCDMKDIAYLVILFNTKPSSSNWNPNADVDNSGVVNMIDIAIAILNYNKHE
jgi:peptide/nickel transport system substrate-binding protein